MSYLRFIVDLAIKQPISSGLQAQLSAIATQILRLQSESEKINPGQIMEENSTRATYHVCHHDEHPPKPCDPEEDISKLKNIQVPK